MLTSVEMNLILTLCIIGYLISILNPTDGSTRWSASTKVGNGWFSAASSASAVNLNEPFGRESFRQRIKLTFRCSNWNGNKWKWSEELELEQNFSI